MKTTIGNFLIQSNKDFPVDAELFDSLQTNTAMLAVIGNIAGDKSILLGCEPEQNNTKRKAGYVFLRTKEYPDGEVLYWEGGSLSAGMYIKTETLAVSAQGYEYPKAYTVRSLAPGIGTETYNWNDFKTIKTNQQLADYSQSQDGQIALLTPPPLGLVYPWAGNVTGNAIPTGYMLCDGTRLLISQYTELYNVIGRLHTAANVPSGYFCLPDLRGRFVVGYSNEDTDYNAPAKAGGEKAHTLKINEIPAHNHGYTAPINSSAHPGGKNGYDRPNGSENGTTTSAGGNGAHENRPPYYTLAYVMRVK